MVSEDEFNEWLGHPVTEWVIGHMKAKATAQRELWAIQAWDGNLDPLLHNEARVRADCYMAIPECTYEDWKANDSEA